MRGSIIIDRMMNEKRKDHQPIRPKNVVLVAGSRDFPYESLIRDELEGLDSTGEVTWILHGGARGADRMAGDLVHEYPNLVELRVPYLRYWNKSGGFARNRVMLLLLNLFRDAGFKTWALVFWEDIDNPSPGTQNMARLLDSHHQVVIHIDAKKMKK